MQFHLDQQIAENIASGMRREDARYAAMRAFGNPTVLKEDTRDTWGWIWLHEIGRDLRHGVRMLRKNPGFSSVAVLTLTLGIGATASIFSVVDSVLLRRLPYRDPSRLVSVYEDRSSTGFPRKQFTPANFADCKAQTAIFRDVAAVDADRFYNLTGNGGTPERLSAEGGTHIVFDFGRPAAGRSCFSARRGYCRF